MAENTVYTELDATRLILRNQQAIMGYLMSGLPNVNDSVEEATEMQLAATRAALSGSYLCEHDWDNSGFSMNGPTRTCKKCGKWERD